MPDETQVWYEFGVEVTLKKHQRIRLWAKNKREIKVCACVCTDSSVWCMMWNLFKSQETRLDEQLRYKRDKKRGGKPESASSIVVSSYCTLTLFYPFSLPLFVFIIILFVCLYILFGSPVEISCVQDAMLQLVLFFCFFFFAYCASRRNWPVIRYTHLERRWHTAHCCNGSW